MVDLRMNEQVAERFWASVDKTCESGCWEWRGGSFDKDGYGVFHVNGQNRRVHRIAFANDGIYRELTECVLHACDNMKCVNPDHLRIGTQAENIADKVARDRCAHGDRHPFRKHPELIKRGSAHGNAKLNESRVVEIFSLWSNGFSRKKIAETMGIDATNVWLILKRKAWAHVQIEVQA